MPATTPTAAAVKNFLDQARTALPGAEISDGLRQRCIGWNSETSNRICDYVLVGEKVGTFSTPWLHKAHPSMKPDIGEYVLLHNYDGVPKALLQTRALKLLPFKRIDGTHTAIDGPGVRDLEAWRKVHIGYWNGLLEPLGKKVVDEMPVIVERFRCVYPAKK
jgi:uncharacterized protein YhfF